MTLDEFAKTRLAKLLRRRYGWGRREWSLALAYSSSLHASLEGQTAEERRRWLIDWIRGGYVFRMKTTQRHHNLRWYRDAMRLFSVFYVYTGVHYER